jgi:hypothetical protein
MHEDTVSSYKPLINPIICGISCFFLWYSKNNTTAMKPKQDRGDSDDGACYLVEVNTQSTPP